MKKTRKIVDMAIMLAILICLNFVSFNVQFIGRASFVYLGGIIAGYLLGPIFGFLIAMAGDAIVAFIAPQGPFSPLIMISTGLMALISGTVYNFLHFRNLSDTKNLVIKIIVSSILIYLICTLVVGGFGNAFFLANWDKSKHFGKDLIYIYKVTLPMRAAKQLAWVAINGITAYLLSLRLKTNFSKPYILKILEKIEANKILEPQESLTI